MALTAGFTASIRAMQASSSSTGEISLVPMRRRSSVAGRAVSDGDGTALSSAQGSGDLVGGQKIRPGRVSAAGSSGQIGRRIFE